MKKLFASLLLASTICLTACEASTSSGDAKANLEGKGYTVNVYNADDTKTNIQGLNWVVEIKDSVVATKGTNQVFLAIYCNNSGDASALLNENISAIYHFAERYVDEPKYGTFNNAVYVGSTTSVSDAGIRL